MLSASLLATVRLPVGAADSWPSVVVSGFQPFAGRGQNASWVLAEAMAALPQQGLLTVEVPVEWGAPLRVIQRIVPAPDIWIAFGEGSREFQIEIEGNNLRGPHRDNTGALPPESFIVAGGPSRLVNPVDAAALAAALNGHGFRTIVSRDAGAYLCEEMLYSLLHTQLGPGGRPVLVLFIHVPVLGARLPVPLSATAIAQSPEVPLVNAASLARFGEVLLQEVLKLHFSQRAG